MATKNHPEKAGVLFVCLGSFSPNSQATSQRPHFGRRNPEELNLLRHQACKLATFSYMLYLPLLFQRKTGLFSFLCNLQMILHDQETYAAVPLLRLSSRRWWTEGSLQINMTLIAVVLEVEFQIGESFGEESLVLNPQLPAIRIRR